MPTFRQGMLAVLVTVFTGGFAQAAEFYVRTDGSDNCNGQTNAAGTSGGCAFKTIYKCESVARCGDTCNIAAGEYFESSPIGIGDACTSTTRKRIVGAGSGNGPDATRVFMALSPPISCSKRGTHTYACPIPSGGLKDSASRSGSTGVCMTLGSNTIDLEPKVGTKYSADTFICLTPASAESNAIDYNDDGVGDSALDSANGRGFWYASASATEYLINPWGGFGPSSTVRFFAPVHLDAGFSVTGPHITLKGMTIYAGSGGRQISVSDAGDFARLEDIVIYGGTVRVGDSFTELRGAEVLDLELYNHTRRKRDKGCGALGNGCDSSSNDFENHFGFVSRGDGMIVDGLRAIGGQEGGSFNGANLTARNIHLSSFTNHGFRMDNRLETATFENVLSYNNQEGLFVANCLKDVTFKHATIHGTVINNGYPGPDAGFDEPCSSGTEQGTWRWKFFNSVVEKFAFTQHYLIYAGAEEVRGNGVAGGSSVSKGWVFDYNTYVTTGPLIQDRYHPSGFGPEDVDLVSLSQWRAHRPSADGCGDCINDPNSQHTTSPWSALFVNPANADLASNPPDYRPKQGSVVINAGSAAYGPSSGKDLDGLTRVDRPDAGAYEYGGTGSAVCGNGAIEGTEQCDGPDLGGASCESLGYGAGTLACSSQCRHDVSGCPPPPAPPAPDSVRRTDQKAG